MLRWLSKVGAWLDARLQVGWDDPWAPWPTPCPETRPAGGTCSGAAHVRADGDQFVTGILLALVYVPRRPTPGRAAGAESPDAFGWFLRAVHGWARTSWWPCCCDSTMSQVFLSVPSSSRANSPGRLGWGCSCSRWGWHSPGRSMRFDADAVLGTRDRRLHSGSSSLRRKWLVGLLLEDRLSRARRCPGSSPSTYSSCPDS